jgi:hypothetical protein
MMNKQLALAPEYQELTVSNWGEELRGAYRSPGEGIASMDAVAIPKPEFPAKN